MIKDYYELTKPGLVYGNIITVIGGFVLGSSVAGITIHFAILIAAIVGISFVIASGCVFNNYIDRDIDVKMERTKDRVLITGRISGRAAIVFGICLGVFGFAVLIFFTNLLTTAVALVGFFFYIVMYSLWGKRHTVHGALIGGISGATPPVVGYVAASGRLDAAALILFLILYLWQMPHFFAIAIRRQDDYAAAGIPVMPVAHGIRATKITMLLYVIAFIIVSSLLTFFGYTGIVYLTVLGVLGLVWLALAIRGFRATDDKKWARSMFLVSLCVMVLLFITISIATRV